ncbi:unnamed protein product, partial [Gadus morhua 'NCC']
NKERDSEEEDTLSAVADNDPSGDLAPGEQREMSEQSGMFVLRPESATAVKGKDVSFVAKVDSKAMLRKPSMKWLKGKWCDLGSKAGKHLAFKETYDRNTKSLSPMKMRHHKVVGGSALTRPGTTAGEGSLQG